MEGTEGECDTPRSRGTVVAGLTIGLTLVMGFLTSIELHDIVIGLCVNRYAFGLAV